MGNLSVFQFQQKQVRTLNIDEEPWFVALDVLQAIDSNTKVTDLKSTIVEGLGDEFVNSEVVSDSLGRGNEMLVIAEAGLTFFISRSRTELGKRFNRWLHCEVLPSIRKTGSYQVNPQQPALPPADVRVANLDAALTRFGFDLENPRFKQGLQDIVGDILGISSQPSLPGGERWLGVAERAEQLGYSVTLVTRYRSQLGKTVKSQGLPSRSEARLCNGTQRLCNLYPVSEELDRAIHAYLEAKLLKAN